MKAFVIVCALVLRLVLGATISSIVIDPTGESVYVITNDEPDPVLYVLDNAAHQVVESHYLSKSVAPDGLYARQGGKRELLAFVGEHSTDLLTFKLPLSNKDTLPTKRKTSISSTDVWIDPKFDEEDSIVIVATGKHVSIVDLQSLKVLDKIRIWDDKNRGAEDNLIYNHNTNRLIVAWKTRPLRGGYDTLHVREFDLSSKRFNEVNTTYNCFCNETSDTSSPFYDIALSNCEVDYTQNKIWCFVDVYNRLYIFNADDLSQFETRYLNASLLYTVRYDFVNRILYTVEGNNTGVFYYVGKYNLDTLDLLGTARSPSDIYSRNYHIALDKQNSYMYLAVENYQTYPPGTSSDFFNASIVIVNTSSMTAHTVVLDKPVGSPQT